MCSVSSHQQGRSKFTLLKQDGFKIIMIFFHTIDKSQFLELISCWNYYQLATLYDVIVFLMNLCELEEASGDGTIGSPGEEPTGDLLVLREP